jgi:uncharacterized protein (DUF1501 family)
MTTRRAFLKAGGVSVVALGLGCAGSPGFLERAALAAPGPSGAQRRRTLVAIFQRGAMDGLMAVQPVADKSLEKLRPRLHLSAARAQGEAALLDLGNGFGLHPALLPLHGLWRERELGIVHAVGSPDPTRSHFDAQDYMESATPGRKGTATGWLDRVLGELGHEGTPFRAVAMTSALPRSLQGEQQALAVSRLEDLHVQAPGGRASAESARGFEALYQQASADLLREAGQEAFEAVAMLGRLDPASYREAAGARYPPSPLGEALRQIAFLIKSDVGLEVAFAESGGWDTHVRQGREAGSFANRARDLAQALAAFWLDLGGLRDQVAVMTMTEFGRTVLENGSAGTDHGHGSCLFLLGTRVDGGRVHGPFPELLPEALYDGRDLPVRTDFRSVFAAVAEAHLGVQQHSAVFPGWQGEPLRLFRS